MEEATNGTDPEQIGSAAKTVMEVADDFRLLIRKEIELMRLELVEGLKAQVVGAGIIALALIGSLPGLLFAVFALTFWLPFSNAVSFAIMSAFLLSFTVGGVIFGRRMMRKRRISLDRSIGSIKEDVEWAREQLTS